MTATKRDAAADIDPIPYRRKPLTEAQRQRMIARIRRWKKREVWLLREACDLAFGFIPLLIARWFNPGAADAEDLQEHAIRSAKKGSLRVGNPTDKPSHWWVEQREFARWVISRVDLVGEDRAAVFARLYPPNHVGSLDVRRAIRSKVLESNYTSPEFEVALAAIAEFWLPDEAGKTQSPKGTTVVDWLEETHPEVCESKAARERIDALIRPTKFKSGGARKQKTGNPTEGQ